MKTEKVMEREEIETMPMEPLSPMSHMLSSPNFFIVITFGFKVRCNPSAFVEGINNSLINAPRFSSKMEIDYKRKGDPVWIPVKVRVEDHVIEPDLEYSNIENPDQFIEDYTSNIANIPMDMSKPLWEFHLLNIKTTKAESLAIVKIHHSIGDGMSLMSLLLACSRKTSDPDALISNTTATKKPVDSMAWWLFVGFWFMIRVTFTTIVEFSKLMLTICFLRDTKNPLMGNPSDGFQSWKVVHRIISFEDVKLVKDTMNMKVNDVLLGMTQAGLSRYLSSKYDGSTAEKKKILEKLRVRGAVAINLRPATKIEDLADMMAKGSKCRWGNFIGTIIFPLWVKPENDPLEYIRRAKATMDRKKISLEAFIFYGIIKFTLKFFGGKAVEAFGKRIFGHTSLAFSNVKGPDEEISFFHHPISYIAGSALVGAQALNIHFISYVDKIVINLAVDTTTIADPHRLCDDMVEALEIIKSATQEKRFHKMEV
ncbi:O-acyltransferase WSD1 C-terminal [Arabidopsis suecica]|uniref:O-acyltransferase WSD1 C-terminal n=1 Tax=Arabidopsis suecica TaxID=45249 RepID=A0A8T1YPR2_ARASU|nr:O-acyltransferase WSD1 C-terminal [Arabidopsis suecica]